MVDTLVLYRSSIRSLRRASGIRSASASRRWVGVHLRAPNIMRAPAYWMRSSIMRLEGAALRYRNLA